MDRATLSLALISILCACAAEPTAKQPEPDKPVEQAKPEPEQARPEPEPEPEPVKDAVPVVEERITITADEAAAAGLPAIGFSLVTTGAGMSGSKLGGGEYLGLSGPPGGPLMLRVSPATVGGEFADLVGGDQVLDATLVEEQVELLGEARRAVAWITGEGLARTSWCAVILGPSGAKQGDPALLLELGVGHRGDATKCATAVDDDVLGPIVRSLELQK